MPYNITNWRTKEIDNLYISMEDIHNLSDTCVTINDDNEITAEGLSEGFELVGILSDGIVKVSKITHSHLFSGNTWDEFLDLLRKSKGKLVATQIWESGDNITKLAVIDGKISEEEVDL